MFAVARDSRQRRDANLRPDNQRNARRDQVAPARSRTEQYSAPRPAVPADRRFPAPDDRPIPARAHDSFARSLYTEYYGPLLSVVLRLTGGDRHWAEDVVQETLLRAWRNAEGLLQRESKSLMPWLATVARRIVINDHWRGRGAKPHDFDDAVLAMCAVPDQTDRTLLRMVIEEGLARLSDAHRTVLVEIYFRGRTVDEVARIVGVPAGTVKSRTYYAMRVMRAVLQERGVTL